MRVTGDFNTISKKKRLELFFPHSGTVEENTWHFEDLWLFSSLIYVADLGRSRLVHLFSLSYACPKHTGYVRTSTKPKRMSGT